MSNIPKNPTDPAVTFQNWTTYRTALSAFIKPNLNKSNILIIGAGFCNDLDLNIFSECQVTLLDTNLEILESGCAHQNYLNYRTLQGDILGLDQTPFMEKLLKGLEKKKLRPTLNAFKEVYEFELDETYDLILVMPVYSQLLLPKIYKSIRKSEELIQETMQFIAERVQLFHNILQNALNPEGKIIALSDVIEYTTDSEEAEYLIEEQSNQVALKEHFETYINTYGHGISSYALLDLAEEMDTSEQHFLIWPFTEESTLLVKGAIYTTKQS